MAQAQIDERGQRFPCKFCPDIFKSEAGHSNHMNRKHPLDGPSGLHCYTCNKAFTKQEILYQHYSTVRHQINCKNLLKDESEEKSEKPTSIREIIQQIKKPSRKRSYRSQLMERIQPEVKKPKRTPVKYLRKDPAIIPLEPTVKQSDPRRALDINLLDLVDLLTGYEDPEESQNHKKQKKYPEFDETTTCSVSREAIYILGSNANEKKSEEIGKLRRNSIAPVDQTGLDLPGSTPIEENTATEEIKDFSTISDKDLNEIIKTIDFTNIFDEIAKLDTEIKKSTETVDPGLDLPLESAIAAKAPESTENNFLDYLIDNNII